MIIIVDSGGANLNSILFALQGLGTSALISHDKEAIKSAERVILPGVGSAAHAMHQLQDFDLVNTLSCLTQPVLGICLGMQLLYDFSEEGDVACLGIIPGKIKRMISASSITIPHMGWNRLHSVKHSSLLDKIQDESYVYFVHSYCAPVNEYTLATTQHGTSFTVAANKDNFYGVQFHPERSSHIGLQILKNFLEL